MDNYAKNNVEWTQNHVDMFTKNGMTNIANVLVECKHLKFPTSEQIAKAEKNLATLEKRKDRFFYNPKSQLKKQDKRKYKKK